MDKLKPGDKIDVRVKSATIVSVYKEYDEIRTFEIVSVGNHGYYLFVPAYLYINSCVIADASQCRRLDIDKRFCGERIVHIQENMVCKVSSVLDGMSCFACGDFFPMAASNQADGTLLCYSCRKNPYR